jgi:hypothetical protein
MRNVRVRDNGHVEKRNGYTEEWDTTVDKPILVCIPENTGYTVNGNGDIHKMGATVVKLHTISNISATPTWFKWNDDIHIYSGARPVKVNIPSNTVSELIAAIPNGKFVAMIATYAVISGYDPTEFTWLVPGNPESRALANGAGFTNIERTGTIQNMIEYRKSLFFFKEHEIEVWGFTGTSIPFRRQTGLTIRKGLGAPNSVVKTNDRFYWFGDDGDFYEYSGGVPIVISDNIRARLDDMLNPEELIGIDVRKENIIKWINPSDGMCLIYDYSKRQWLEDNRWEGSGWQALPFRSYMELNNEQFFGSANYDGLIHKWSSDSLDDNGQPIRVFRHWAVRLSQSDNRVRVDKLRFRRKGATATSSETTPLMTIRTRFDKGAWVTHENLSLGIHGDTDPYIDLNRIGVGRELEIEISEMDAVKFLLTDVKVFYQELTI